MSDQHHWEKQEEKGNHQFGREGLLLQPLGKAFILRILQGNNKWL